ncbi:hypothetical protein [Actinoplanes solisilvae]|uniref:hypothetical protein n=1 Tax=Actinoplanes solisilvae TaxID=2486853 RepID=UPI0013E39B75|nr:hypothetical protein [Actinoplanes solisilvae]
MLAIVGVVRSAPRAASPSALILMPALSRLMFRTPPADFRIARVARRGVHKA